MTTALLRISTCSCAAVLLAGCSAFATQGADPMLRRLSPQAPAFATLSGYETQIERVIRSADDWQSSWRQLHGRMPPPGEPPYVDFSRESVVIVAAGRQRSGGHSVRILRAELRGAQTIVHARIESPGRGCIVMSAITAPADVAVVASTTRDWDFAIERITVDCESADKLH